MTDQIGRATTELEISQEALAAFCAKWRIKDFALFGSVLRADFGPDSDIDVLASFDSDVTWDLLDVMQMREELAALLGRDVDILDKEAVEHSSNPFRRREILRTKRVVFSRA